MRGLDPRIHRKKSQLKRMDCRVKPGNDNSIRINRVYAFADEVFSAGVAASSGTSFRPPTRVTRE